MTCPACGQDNPTGKKFCGDCGAALESRCPQCHALNPPGKKFCGDCGAQLQGSGVGGNLTPFVLVERAGLAELRGEVQQRETYLREAHEAFTRMGASRRAAQVAAMLGP